MPASPRKADQLRRFSGDARQRMRPPPDRKAAGMARLHRQAQVLLHRQRREQIGDLERTADAVGGDVLRTPARDRAARKLDRAAIGRIEAGQEIECRGLAGTIGPDQRVQCPIAYGEGHVVDRMNAPETLVEVAHHQHRRFCLGLTAQRLRQRRILDQRAARHCRRERDTPAERGDQPLGHADQARRREHDEADEQQAEIEQPMQRPDRQKLAEQDEEQGAERRPQEASHSADDHHGDELAREGDRQGFGRGETVIEDRQCSRQPHHRRGQDKSDELVPIRRIAHEAGALLVLPDRHQHATHRRAVKAPEQVTDGAARLPRPRRNRPGRIRDRRRARGSA